LSIDEKTKAKLGELRVAIDSVDERILVLLNDRARLALEVGKVKETVGASFYVPAREEDLVRHLQEANRGPFPDSGIRPVWKEIISASLSLEHPLAVAYFGPQATFTHQACTKQFGLSARYIPVRTIAEVFDYVEKGKAAYGVIPVENTTEGAVNNTLDKFMESDTKIVGEVLLPISHYLLNRSGNIADITRIYSHPQPLAQCRKWLEANLPTVPLVEAASTAQAAKIAAEEEDAAAIAAELAGEIYGLRTVEARIEDNPNNFTRFLVIGKEIPEPAEKNKTSILFAVKDQAGALHQALGIFYECGVNLTKIESRPHKVKAWEYVFFVDLEGYVNDAPVKAALSRLGEACQSVKILGSYPRAEPID
jgi:chorismate mutase/prephenate dehydratase